MPARNVILCASGAGHYLGPQQVAGFCAPCATRLLREVRAMQDLDPTRLATVAAMLHDAGAVALSCAVIGAIPFETRQAG